MEDEIVELQEDISNLPLYSEDLAPVPKSKRTWNMWSLAALWVGMAVCIPTYLLASYMIKSGQSWLETLIIIGLANLIITVPMVLNGHAGVKYGIPFPVIGRAAFGHNGTHIPSVVRGLVACGWFGIQTWIGGLAIYAIFNAITGSEPSFKLTAAKFICFIIFWFINMFFIWKGTESIKWLEIFSAPILILMGILLIGWGAYEADGFGVVLQQSKQLQKPAYVLEADQGDLLLSINPLKTKEGIVKANEYRVTVDSETNEMPESTWQELVPNQEINLTSLASVDDLKSGETQLSLQLRFTENSTPIVSSVIDLEFSNQVAENFGDRIWGYILWLTAMVGFWATMAISISDITRFAPTQKAQVAGQFLGLPVIMMLFSFVAIFVTCAAVINFNDILIGTDAPWDPVSLLAKFDHPWVVVISQIFLIIATLSTNIAANVIAPSNAFSNLWPSKLSFKAGGTITGIIGIILCPWWLLDEVSGVLVFVSGLLGPVLGILLADYFVVRKKQLQLAELFKSDGVYSYGGNGFNSKALIALFVGVLFAIVGFWIKELDFLYSLSWFTGFAVSFFLYIILMKKETVSKEQAF